jgi:hypothetical protein
MFPWNLHSTVAHGLTINDAGSGDMSQSERLDYIQAVHCLLKAPSKLSSSQYPGAKTRYDDFVVVHMNMTPSVHMTVRPKLEPNDQTH